MNKNNQTALITGAATGIGLEFTKLFHLKGYNLVLVSRSKKRLEQVKADLGIKDDSVVLIESDLSVENSAQKLFNECEKQGLEVDILVNNAGFGLFGDHVDLPTEQIGYMITLNITSLTILCSLFGKEMKKRNFGYILNIASTAAYQAVPYFAAYSAAKSYVLNFSEALTKEMEGYNVNVTCLSPGHTDTDFFKGAGIGNENGGFFDMKARMSAEKVAEYGIQAMFAKKMSAMPGLKNKIVAFSNRLVSRKIAANIAKKLIKKTLELPKGLNP